MNIKAQEAEQFEKRTQRGEQLEKKAQGALEYLLLLAAAVVVVAVVISFMISTIKPVEESSDKQTLDFICVTLKTNNLMCGCYLCDNTLGGYSKVTGTNVTAGKITCFALYGVENNPLIDPTTRCVGKPGF